MAGFTAIQSEVIARLGNRTDLSARSAVWINDAYFELLMNPTFEFFELDTSSTFTMIVGQASYDLPTNLWFILDITDTINSRKLERTHWQVLDRVVATSGQPTRYARFAGKIQLDPVPDSANALGSVITIRYRIRPGELSTGSSTALGREW